MSKTSATKRKRVIITGANGFVGSNLTKFLSQDPTLEVFAMVRPNAPVNFLRDFQFKEDTSAWLPPVPKGTSPASFAHLRQGLQHFIIGRILSPKFGEIPNLKDNTSELQAILRIAA